MKDDLRINGTILKMYKAMDRHFGDLGWWPARSRFEVIVGAILTQNTSWKNVEKSIKELRDRKLLTIEGIKKAKKRSIEDAVRSSGYYRQKAERLKIITDFLVSEGGSRFKKFHNIDTDVFRRKLLSVKGVGPETADSILLYAFERPIFVVDAYTMRIFERHGLIKGTTKYETVQNMVHSAMGNDARAFNRFHAAIVEIGKRFCRKKAAVCEECPMRDCFEYKGRRI
jgi:endonuclease III related protein